MDLGIVRIGVMIIGACLAFGYIKELSQNFSDEEEKEINDSANQAMTLFPKKVWTTAIIVIQGFRVLVSLGFTVGAVLLLNGLALIAPLALVLTDAAYVIYSARRMLKIAHVGEITETEETSNVHYFLNLLLVGITIGSLF